MAIVGAGADLIFSLSDWGASPIADVVAGTDTLAAWWRTQEIASGLEFKAAEDFKTWAHDRSDPSRRVRRLHSLIHPAFGGMRL